MDHGPLPSTVNRWSMMKNHWSSTGTRKPSGTGYEARVDAGAPGVHTLSVASVSPRNLPAREMC